MTRTFPLGVILSMTTRRLLCSFSDMHEAAEFVMGHSIWSHEFGFRPMTDRLRAAVLQQVPTIEAVDASEVTSENWHRFLVEQEAIYGKEFELYQGSQQRTDHPVTTAMKMAGQL